MDTSSMHWSLAELEMDLETFICDALGAGGLWEGNCCIYSGRDTLMGGGYTLWICLGLSFRFDCSFLDIYLVCTICVLLARSAQSVSCVGFRGTALL
jgi:hypothetical protein